MPSVSQYQQSSTRRLAFGGVGTDSNQRMKKQLDFYKNTTLTNLSKLFCAIVLVTAFFLVMSRSFNFEAHFPDGIWGGTRHGRHFATLQNNSILPYSVQPA
ncbi:unnamed protein product, partial [Mesorhabditis spiculigera]